MKIALLAFLGVILGAIAGGGIGLGAGLAWITIFKTSSFEGYSGMLVGFVFIPIGGILGAILGGILLGRMGARG